MKNNLPIIKNRKIKIGVVGCGRISKNHFSAIDDSKKNLELRAVCDIDEKSFNVSSIPASVNRYTGMEEMLHNEDLDVVTICTPSGLHAQQTILAAEHGVNVICEKPMATRYMDGLKMVKACDKAATRLFVVKQNRLNQPFGCLKGL